MVLATCDNAFSMKVNGTAVAASRDWQIPVRFNIASQLIKGDNKIEVAGEMFGGSAGFICQLILLENGTRRVITTDKSWEVRKPGGAWQAALEVHPYGNGPWGRVFDGKTVTSGAFGLAGPPVRAALMQNNFLMRSLGRAPSRSGRDDTTERINDASGNRSCERRDPHQLPQRRSPTHHGTGEIKRRVN